MVELAIGPSQDLILSRALVELYSEGTIRNQVAFRGRTALHKIFLAEPARYCDDIDLVQVEEGPIGVVMDAVRVRLAPWLSELKWKQARGRATFYYRVATEIEPVMWRARPRCLADRTQAAMSPQHGRSSPA